MASQRIEPRPTPGHFLKKKSSQKYTEKTALLIEQFFLDLSLCREKEVVEKNSTLLICPTQKFL